jgi:hypothetical protein
MLAIDAVGRCLEGATGKRESGWQPTAPAKGRFCHAVGSHAWATPASRCRLGDELSAEKAKLQWRKARRLSPISGVAVSRLFCQRQPIFAIESPFPQNFSTSLRTARDDDKGNSI